ncbi:hypothetical protein ACLOJK_009900 [Asimina triloba]
MLTHGLAEYIAQEEMDRKTGFWWSPDSKYIAFTEVDASEIPLFRIMHQGKNSVGSDSQEDHAYPFAGMSNVQVRLGVVSACGGPITWMDLLCGKNDVDSNDEEYLARVNWMPGNCLIAQVLNRSHSKLKILRFDINTGRREVLLVEEQETWVNLHECFTPLDKGVNEYSGGFIWASDKTGFRHLYLHDKNGICLGPITEGDWMVEQVTGVNENAGLVYFTGTKDGPLESNLYCSNLFPDRKLPLQAPQRLTHGNGRHAVVLDHQMQRFVDVHDSLNTPPRVSLCSLQDGSLIMTIYEQPSTVPRFKRLQLHPPEIVQIEANDGTILYGALYKPDPKRFGPPPYKTLISVYGGPSVQFVCDSWMNTVDMRAQYLRNKGILVWKSPSNDCQYSVGESTPLVSMLSMTSFPQKDEHWENSERFCFHIDRLEHDADVFEYMRNHQKIMITDGRKPIPQWAGLILADDLLAIFVATDVLSNLEVYDCSKMEYVLTTARTSGSGSIQGIVLPKLENVHLEGQPKRRSIWMRTALLLENVRRLSSVKCHGLNVVLSPTLANGLAKSSELDNRGTARRGLKFEGSLKYNVGRIDAEDQVTGAEWLIKQGLAKAGRLGLYGWSYGGYLSAMALARFPEMFRCAVAGAPVTTWDGYDTFYTEKYMGLPSENPAGYEYSSVMHHVHKIKGKLLLVHGMIDENVHFRHTARLVNAFVAAGKPYELLVFPDERHMPRRLRDRIYMEERMWEFVDRNLGPVKRNRLLGAWDSLVRERAKEKGTLFAIAIAGVSYQGTAAGEKVSLLGLGGGTKDHGNRV